MRTCTHCGLANEEDAIQCRECGTELVPAQAVGERPVAEEGLERIGVLDNEAQAGLLDSILADRKIPHIIQTYHDSAFDGVFQTQKGYGIILAPPAFSEEVLAALEEIKRQSQG